MNTGDFVWFRQCDDAWCGCGSGTNNNLHETEFKAGQIFKLADKLCWVSSVCFASSKDSVPLWAIPNNLLRKMSDEEAMLAMLEDV